MLQSDSVLALLDIDVGGEEADPPSTSPRSVKQALSKDADGKYRVLPEVAENLSRRSRTRSAPRRRRPRLQDRLHARREDRGQGASRGLHLALREVRGRAHDEGALSLRSYDGLKSWIDRHFEAAGTAFKIGAASKGEIETILAEVERLEKESKKNDLKD
jgi:hypothetical protein